MDSGIVDYVNNPQKFYKGTGTNAATKFTDGKMTDEERAKILIDDGNTHKEYKGKLLDIDECDCDCDCDCDELDEIDFEDEDEE